MARIKIAGPRFLAVTCPRFLVSGGEAQERGLVVGDAGDTAVDRGLGLKSEGGVGVVGAAGDGPRGFRGTREREGCGWWWLVVVVVCRR